VFFFNLQKSPNPTKLRYPNSLDELETSPVERFSVYLITFQATILESNQRPLQLRQGYLSKATSASTQVDSMPASDFLEGLTASDAVVWTDGSVCVPSPLGAGGAGVQTAFRGCLSSSSLTYSTGPSPLAFQLSPLYWYMVWNGVTPICRHSTFNRPSPSGFLSSRVALSFQWVLGHAGLPGNELAGSLAKTGVTLLFSYYWPRSLQK